MPQKPDGMLVRLFSSAKRQRAGAHGFASLGAAVESGPRFV